MPLNVKEDLVLDSFIFGLYLYILDIILINEKRDGGRE